MEALAWFFNTLALGVVVGLVAGQMREPYDFVDVFQTGAIALVVVAVRIQWMRM